MHHVCSHIRLLLCLDHVYVCGSCKLYLMLGFTVWGLVVLGGLVVWLVLVSKASLGLRIQVCMCVTETQSERERE